MGCHPPVLNMSYDGPTVIHEQKKVFWRNSGTLGAAIAFSFVAAMLSLTIPLFMLLVYDRVLNARSMETLSALALIAFITLAFMGVFDYTRRRLLARFAGRFQKELETNILRVSQNPKRPGGKRLSKISALDGLRGFFHSGDFIKVLDVPWLPIYIFVVFIINSSLGWLAIVGVLLTSFTYGIGRLLGSNRRAASKLAANASARETQDQNYLFGMLKGQFLSREATNQLITKRTYARNAAIRSNDAAVLLDVVLSTLRWGLSVAVLSLGASLVLQGQLTVGGMVASVVLLNRVISPYVAFLKCTPKLFRAASNWKSLSRDDQFEFLPQTITRNTDNATLLELNSITIHGQNTTRSLLKNVNLKISPGEVVQISGCKGAGKTILCDTIARVRRPSRGAIYLHGCKYSLLPDEEMGHRIGYICETSAFFCGSIAANISGRESEVVTEKIEEAAVRAQLHSDVMNLPDGYATEIDVFASALCRGTRELLTLARVLYKKPFLILVDEPSDTIKGCFSSGLSDVLSQHISSGGSLLLVGRTFHDLSVRSRHLVMRERSLQEIEPNKSEIGNLSIVKGA